MASSENQMRDRIIKLEREVETFRRDMDIDRDMTHLKSSPFFRNSTPAGTPMPPTKQPTVTKATVIKAVPFKGTETEIFLLWLQNYEQRSRVNGWSDDYKIVHIVTMLQEDANRKYWECSKLARTNWVLLTEALKQKFNPESSRSTFEAALENRKRKQNETSTCRN